VHHRETEREANFLYFKIIPGHYVKFHEKNITNLQGKIIKIFISLVQFYHFELLNFLFRCKGGYFYDNERERELSHKSHSNNFSHFFLETMKMFLLAKETE
jgi:hypothetical protein